jgi:hypothetical protein
MWLQRGDLGFVLPVPTTAAEPLADALDLDLASDRAAGRVAGTGQGCPVPDEVRLLLPGCPASWQEHDDLLVDGVEVEWWVEGAGPQALVHADTLAGLARGLAQAAGDWSRRLLVESVLLEPAESDRLLVEEALTTPDRPTP